MTDDKAHIREEIEFWRELIENWWVDHSGSVPETAWEALAEAERKLVGAVLGAEGLRGQRGWDIWFFGIRYSFQLGFRVKPHIVG